MTRPSRVGWVRFPHSPATASILSILSILAACCLAPSSLDAQVDTARVDTTRVDTTRVNTKSAVVGKAVLCKKPGRKPGAPIVPKIVIAGEVPQELPDCRVPISPRAALVRSLLVPGLGQFNLDRPKTAWMFVGVEIGSFAMVFKSKHDLNAAVAARRDTTIEKVTDSSGQPVIDPATGLQKTIGKPKNQDLADRVKARRVHLEDWIATIVFNHLFSGADAWVAANLADFDSNVNVTADGRGVQIAARVAW